MREKILERFEELKSKKKLNDKEVAVFEIIRDKGPVTQRQICKNETWLGRHVIHETHLPPTVDSTARQVRQIINDLRNEHGLAIMKGVHGHWLPQDMKEAQHFIASLERETRAVMRARVATYNAMKEALGVESPYMERQRELFEKQMK